MKLLFLIGLLFATPCFAGQGIGPGPGVGGGVTVTYSITLNVVSGTSAGVITVNGTAIESVAGYTTSGVATGCQGKLVLTGKSAIGATLSGYGGGGGGSSGVTGGDGGYAAFITNMASVPVYSPDPIFAWTNTGTVWAAATGGGGGDDDDGDDNASPGASFGTVPGGSAGNDSAGGTGTTDKMGFTGGSSGTGTAGTSGGGGYAGGSAGLLSGVSYSLPANTAFYVGIYGQYNSGAAGYIHLTTTP